MGAGVADALAALLEPTAVASSPNPLLSAFGRLGIPELSNSVFTGDEDLRGEPGPDAGAEADADVRPFCTIRASMLLLLLL